MNGSMLFAILFVFGAYILFCFLRRISLGDVLLVTAWSLGLFTWLLPQSSHSQSTVSMSYQKNPIASPSNLSSYAMDCSQAGPDETSSLLTSTEIYFDNSMNISEARKKKCQ